MAIKVWRDREGRWIDAKEFRERFSKGVQGITPLQQTKSQIFFAYLTIMGIICGIIVSILSIKTLWWLGIILLAALGNTMVGLVGTYQKYKQLKNIQQIIREEHKRGL